MPWEAAPDITNEEYQSLVREFRNKSRFLVDENLGVEVARALRDLGWNTKYVGDLDLVGHSDEDVFARAWSDERIILTHDHDFLDDRRFPPHRNPGVVVLPGAQGNEDALLRALAGMLSMVAPFRDAYWRTKVGIAADETWTFIRRNAKTGDMEKTRLRGVRRGPVEVWRDANTRF